MSTPRPEHYILRDGEPVPTDLLTWARWLDTAGDQRILQKTRVGDLEVSTIFVGLDHNFCEEGPALLYETMVFDRSPNKDGESRDLDLQRHYATREQALRGHEEMVACLGRSAV